MKKEEIMIESPARTILKSTAHIRVREKSGNYLRSIAVGLQFGVVHFPGEVLTVVLIPLVRNTFVIVYEALANLLFVVRAAGEAIIGGFAGRLEATDEPMEYEEEDAE